MYVCVCVRLKNRCTATLHAASVEKLSRRSHKYMGPASFVDSRVVSLLEKRREVEILLGMLLGHGHRKRLTFSLLPSPRSKFLLKMYCFCMIKISSDENDRSRTPGNKKAR